MRLLRLALIALAAAVGACSASAFARPAPPASKCVTYALEASVRSGLGQDVITRVMQAESAGRPNAISPRGAIGCMQIMPATWAYLTQRYGLGSDPFDARMNMIGGALYLAELTRRFGLPGAYAAYNAGPGRYVRFAVNGGRLPAETVAYAARLGGAAAPAFGERSRAHWQEAGLFLHRRSEGRDDGGVTAKPALEVSTSGASEPMPIVEARSHRMMATLFPPLVTDAGTQR